MSPAVETEVDEVLEDETLENEDEVLDEEVDEETKKSKRQTLSADNKYIFTNKDKAKAAIDDNAIKYKDGSSVQGFRVWEIVDSGEWDDKGEMISGTVKGYVLARTQHQASHLYLESLSLSSSLAFKMRRGGFGRGKTKVTQDILAFGQLLAEQLFVDENPANDFLPTAKDNHKENWNTLFGSDGTYAHYLNEDKTWKEPN